MKKITKIIVLSVLLGLGGSLNFSVVNAQQIDSQTYIENISDLLFENVDTVRATDKKSVLKNFCETVLVNDGHVFVEEGFYYEADQSLLLALMCGSVLNSDAYMNPYLQQKYLTTYNLSFYRVFLSLTNLRVLSYTQVGLDPLEMDTCNPDNFNMKSCNLTQEFGTVFDHIASDAMSVKQANILGLKTDDTSVDSGMSLEEQANDFAKQGYGVQLCDLEGDGECEYPKTQNRLVNYLNQAKRLYKSVKLLDYANIFKSSILEDPNGSEDLSRKYQCSEVSKISEEIPYNIVMCALYSEVDKSMKPFLNFLYNEMFFYRLFAKYYAALEEYHTSFYMSDEGKVEFWMGTDYAEKTEYQVYIMNKRMEWSQKSIALSIKMLNEMQETYPMHIGFALYYEKLLSFREELAKIVTPIYTLYDKLRNVQVASD